MGGLVSDHQLSKVKFDRGVSKQMKVIIWVVCLLWVTPSIGRSNEISLVSSDRSVELEASDDLARHIKHSTKNILLFSIRYPSGLPAPRKVHEGRDIFEVQISALNSRAASVAEGYLDGHFAASIGARLEQQLPDGTRIYSEQLSGSHRRVVRAFRGRDGNAVAAYQAMDFQVLAKSERKFANALRVIYLYPSTISDRSADEFVLGYLNKHLQVHGSMNSIPVSSADSALRP